MTPDEFVKKWSAIQQNERAAAQSHFNDVCALVGHLTPLEFDPTGQNFSFETQTVKPGGTKGFADVYFRDHFIWEYKGPHKDLQKAYNQLLLYRESLGNPPLLIVSDIHRIIIYTNFTNRPTYKYEIGFDQIQSGKGLELLKRVFFNPESFEPELTREFITQANANTFVAVADSMKKHLSLTKVNYLPEQLAHFMVRILFCLFAQDMDILPNRVFDQIIKAQGKAHTNFQHALRYLFREMRQGGMFGVHVIPWFNGSLFDDEFVPEIPDDLGYALLKAIDQNWSAIEPSIFGTIFERVIDESKRAQLGAHYTSQADIELLVEPVLMTPLREKWEQIQQQLRVMLLGQPHEDIKEQAYQQLVTFSQEIAQIKVLDPACGSGNFLYVALRRLLDLQRDVIAYAQRRNLPAPPLTVSPQQMFGLEINPYAYELAQITVWIGYLQWRAENGFSEIEEPILKSLNNIKCMDAILGFDTEGSPIQPEWPAVDVIIGNPPFLGSQKLLREFNPSYVKNLRVLYKETIPQGVDLVVYWFERSRQLLGKNQVKRVGLLATQSIRAGANRTVLENIKKSGDIFMAWSDNPWVLEGASVRVSLIGFDQGLEKNYILNGKKVNFITANLSSSIDMAKIQRLSENFNISFKGNDKSGAFQINYEQAQFLLSQQNRFANYKNSDVVKIWINGFDVVRRFRNMWIIDFDGLPLEEVQKYEAPFEYVVKYVKPNREHNRETRQRVYWWQFARPRLLLREAIKNLHRYIVTVRVAKHRIFTFLNPDVVPDSRLYIIAREDDYFFGILHSKTHEIWSLVTSSRHGDGTEGGRPTYNNTTCFETFPFPWVPGREPAADPYYQAISHWAKTLHEWREKWLNPPPPNGTKTVDPNFEKLLKQRTLTNLYNALGYHQQSQKEKNFTLAGLQKAGNKAVTLNDMEEFATIHQQLDTAVLAAYGLPGTAAEDEILDCLLALNAQRAEENGEIIGSSEEDEEEELDID